jgi:hypothetical protein
MWTTRQLDHSTTAALYLSLRSPLTRRRARRGLWSARKVELPGDFKKRAREGDTEAKEVKMGQPDAWWERMGRWLGGKT